MIPIAVNTKRLTKLADRAGKLAVEVSDELNERAMNSFARTVQKVFNEHIDIGR